MPNAPVAAAAEGLPTILRRPPFVGSAAFISVPTMFVQLTPQLRDRIEATIGDLVAILDMHDGDADFEPDAGDEPEIDAGDSGELDEDFEEDAGDAAEPDEDFEPAGGWSNSVDQLHPDRYGRGLRWKETNSLRPTDLT